MTAANPRRFKTMTGLAILLLASVVMVLWLAAPAGAQETVPLTLTLEAPAGSSLTIDVYVDGEWNPTIIEAGQSIAVPVLPGKPLDLFVLYLNSLAVTRLTCTGDGGALWGSTQNGDLDIRGTLPETTTAVNCVLVYSPRDEVEPVPINITVEAPDARPIVIEYNSVVSRTEEYELSRGQTLTVDLVPELKVTASPLGGGPTVASVECTRTYGMYTDSSPMSASFTADSGPVATQDSIDCTFTFDWSDTVLLTGYGPDIYFSGVTDAGPFTNRLLGLGESQALSAPHGGTLEITAEQAGTIVCTRDGQEFARSELIDGVAHLATSTPVGAGFVRCAFVPDLDTRTQIYPTVSCLAGNGRIDVNIQTMDSLEYTLRVGNLTPRVRNVEAGDWWRSPVTGRSDGPIPVQVTVHGVTVLDTVLTVACDDGPVVTSPEVQPIVACRGGNGFVVFQFANPTSESRGYVIEFTGVANRSTTAAPFGATVRGVSGRADGTYDYRVRVAGVLIADGAVTVDC